METITSRKQLSDFFLQGLDEDSFEKQYIDDHHAIANAILTKSFETIEKLEQLNRWPDSYSLFYSYRELFNND